MRITPPTILIAVVSFGAMAAVTVFLALTISRADESDSAQRYDRRDAPECAGFGSASFVEAGSLEDLLSKADTVVKGKITDRYNDSGTLGRNYLVYDIGVSEVLVGDVADLTITLGLDFAEVCLAPGDYEYYFFIARTQEPAPGTSIINNPAQFSLHSFGPQNVFPIESGLIDGDSGFGLEQYDGVTEQSFDDAVREAASLTD